MEKKITNVAYIDGTNLHQGIKNLGKELDYIWFRKWLLWKYRITHAYIFMGYIVEQKSLYEYLENAGFILVFKEVILQGGVIKGNADAELVLKSVRDFYEETPQKVVLISGDGDFSCLIDFLKEKNIFHTLIIPNKRYCSRILRKKKIRFVFLQEILSDKLK